MWPQDPGQDGWWDGLPYPLHDMRPQGYLGRILANHFAATLDVPRDPGDWSDDDIIWYLAQFGADVPGNLIVGQRAMQLWTLQRTQLQVLSERKVKDAYLQRAQSALKLVAVSSSAGGEFGKIPDHAAARSRIIQAQGRTFLESERFDRTGEYGRSAVVTLSAVEAALIGAGPKAWPAVLQSAAAARFFERHVIDRVEELWWFGRFIANTDMHHGNVSLLPQGAHFQLAPAYDMLPMQYAPLRGGDVPEGDYALQDLPLPRRGSEERWQNVLSAAISFWNEAARDRRISEPFRKICASNGQSLERWADTWAHLLSRGNVARMNAHRRAVLPGACGRASRAFMSAESACGSGCGLSSGVSHTVRQ